LRKDKAVGVASNTAVGGLADDDTGGGVGTTTAREGAGCGQRPVAVHAVRGCSTAVACGGVPHAAGILVADIGRRSVARIGHASVVHGEHALTCALGGERRGARVRLAAAATEAQDPTATSRRARSLGCKVAVGDGASSVGPLALAVGQAEQLRRGSTHGSRAGTVHILAAAVGVTGLFGSVRVLALEAARRARGSPRASREQCAVRRRRCNAASSATSVIDVLANAGGTFRLGRNVVTHQCARLAVHIPNANIGVLARRLQRRGRARRVALIVHPLAAGNVGVATNLIGSGTVALGALVHAIVPLASAVGIASRDGGIAEVARNVADTIGSDARRSAGAHRAERAALGAGAVGPQAARIGRAGGLGAVQVRTHGCAAARGDLAVRVRRASRRGVRRARLTALRVVPHTTAILHTSVECAVLTLTRGTASVVDHLAEARVLRRQARRCVQQAALLNASVGHQFATWVAGAGSAVVTGIGNRANGLTEGSSPAALAGRAGVGGAELGAGGRADFTAHVHHAVRVAVATIRVTAIQVGAGLGADTAECPVAASSHALSGCTPQRALEHARRPAPLAPSGSRSTAGRCAERARLRDASLVAEVPLASVVIVAGDGVTPLARRTLARASRAVPDAATRCAVGGGGLNASARAARGGL